VGDSAGAADREATWIGIRQIDWQDGVFHINGQGLQLRGLNRHQTYPFIGGAVPNRLQRRDALTLKYGLGVNTVRSSHYPDDRDFYNRTYGLAKQLDPSRRPGGARLGDAWHGKIVPEEVLGATITVTWTISRNFRCLPLFSRGL
jgi:hypothetical protein